MSSSACPRRRCSSPRSWQARASACPSEPAPQMSSGRALRAGARAGERLRGGAVEVLARGLPPAGRGERRMLRPRPQAQGADEPCEGGGPRRRCPAVEGARLVVARGAGQQAVPVVAAEQCPRRYREHLAARGACLGRGLPRIVQTAQLLLARAADVHLGEGERYAVALPGRREHFPAAVGAGQHAHRLDVRVALAGVAAPGGARVRAELLIEVAVAGDVVVDADDIRRTRLGREHVELGGRGAVGLEEGTQRMRPVHAPAQEVPGEPAPLVVELGLVAQPLGAVGGAEVFGLHQSCRRIDAADRLHGEPRGGALVQQRAHEGARFTAVRVPVTIEAAEAGRGERLVHRGVVLNPGGSAARRGRRTLQARWRSPAA